MPLFILFLLVPLIEIALFIQVGGLIGLWPTLGIVVLTAIIGTYMIRDQGLRELGNLRQSFEGRGDPTEALAFGAMILFAGALLLTPGFFTDTVGFLLLIPGFRRWALAQVRDRMNVQSFTTSQMHDGPPSNRTTRPGGDVIEGEYSEVDYTDGKPGNSGWTKH